MDCCSKKSVSILSSLCLCIAPAIWCICLCASAEASDRCCDETVPSHCSDSSGTLHFCSSNVQQNKTIIVAKRKTEEKVASNISSKPVFLFASNEISKEVKVPPLLLEKLVFRPVESDLPYLPPTRAPPVSKI